MSLRYDIETIPEYYEYASNEDVKPALLALLDRIEALERALDKRANSTDSDTTGAQK